METIAILFQVGSVEGVFCLLLALKTGELAQPFVSSLFALLHKCDRIGHKVDNKH